MRPVTADDAIKSIRIKTGSLRRLFKERAMYAEEIVAGERKVAEMRARGAEPSDIKQQENVLQESVLMVNDNATRVHDARNDLDSTAEHFGGDDAVRESEEYKAAMALLQEVAAVLDG